MTIAPSLCAQTDACRSRELSVVVRDSRGVPIDDLLPEDFSARIKGKPVPAVSLTAGDRPRRAVMLLDTSGSMKGFQETGQWKLALAIVNQFANAFSPHGQLAFLSFDESIHETIDFSKGNSAVLAQLRRMMDGNGFSAKQVHGRTALFDAVHSGWQLLEKPSPADVVFVVTDGGDNKSRLKQEALERELIQSGVRLYAVLVMDTVGGSGGRTPEELNGPDILGELARTTGGELFGPVGYRRGHYIYYDFSKYSLDDKMNIGQALMIFYEGLFHRKTLKLELPVAPFKKEETLDLKLSGSAERKWKGAVISYPQKLLPCRADRAIPLSLRCSKDYMLDESKWRGGTPHSN
jgi:hypothetical protein